MGVLQDLRFGVRVLVKDRWFTIMAAFVLALGIGANNTVFTLVNAVLLRSLPFEKPDQLMMVWTRDSRGRDSGVSLADFEDWRRSARTFSHLTFVFSGSFNVSDEGRLPEQYPGSYVSSDFFKMLGVSPVLGRDFGPGDDGPGGPPVVMLGNAIWKQRYGGDPSVLGRVVRLNGVTATVAGVMPEGMKFPFEAELWLPTSQLAPALRQQPRQSRGFVSIGRLADSVSLDQARAEFKTIGAQLAREYPASNKDLAPYAEPFEQQVVGSQIRLMFWSLMGAVAFVLLIACANVANLLLARAARRSNEMSVRVAIGASRWQIVRQLLIESLLLALLAGGLGLLLSIFGVRWFDGVTQNVGKPYWMTFTMDWRTFAFLLVVCIATGIVFGLVPALHVSRTSIAETLKEGGRTGTSGIRARRWTTGLVVAEIALTLVLLAGAGFMMRSFLSMYRMDVGVDTSRILTMNLIMPVRKYPSLKDRVTFLNRIEERLSAAPEIESVSSATSAPFSGGATRQIEIGGGRPAESQGRPTVTMLSVGARYFDTIGVRIVRGRVFTTAEEENGRPAVVINERLASLYFRGQNPVDQQIRLVDEGPGAPNPEWLTVVGVVANVRQRTDNQNADYDPVAYVPNLLNDALNRGSLVLIRTRTDPLRAARTLREAVREVDPDMALFNVRPLDTTLEQRRWVFRVFGTMFSAFAIIALLLAAVGLYGVTAYAVSQQTREIGMRVVLGAAPVQVIWLFLKRSFVQLGIGLTIGIAGAVGVGRLLESLLFQTSPYDPITLAAIVVVLTTVGVVACVSPARRATRLDPVVVLRNE
jgi:predicted permease